MYFVYFLSSLRKPEKYYVGITNNLSRRIDEHNHKSVNSYIIRYRPWKIKCYIAVENYQKALELEKYFKSCSGKAFYRKRFS